MNSYNLLHPEESSFIVLHAIANDTDHIKRMAEEKNINIEGLEIVLERKNVKTEMGKDCSPKLIVE